MRHKVAGYKLGRTTSHRRAMLRNMVTSIIMEERIETTVIKAKAVRPSGREDDHAREKGRSGGAAAGGGLFDDRTKPSTKLFDTVAPRFGDRQGGYTAHRPHRMAQG